MYLLLTADMMWVRWLETGRSSQSWCHGMYPGELSRFGDFLPYTPNTHRDFINILVASRLCLQIRQKSLKWYALLYSTLFKIPTNLLTTLVIGFHNLVAGWFIAVNRFSYKM